MYKKITVLLLLVLSSALSFVMSYKQADPKEFSHFGTLINTDVKFKFIALLLIAIMILATFCVFYIYTEISYYITSVLLKTAIPSEQTFFAVAWFMIITSYQFILYFFMQKSLLLAIIGPFNIIGVGAIYFIYKHYRLKNKDAMIGTIIIYLLSILVTIWFNR